MGVAAAEDSYKGIAQVTGRLWQVLSVMKVDRATTIPMESPTGSLRQLPAPLTARQCQELELDRGEDPVRYEIDGEGQCHEPRELFPD